MLPIRTNQLLLLMAFCLLTTLSPTVAIPTTKSSTTKAPVTPPPTTVPPTTVPPTTVPPTTVPPTTAPPTTVPPTTVPPTTAPPTTAPPTTAPPTTAPPTTAPPTTVPPTTAPPTTAPPTTAPPTTVPPTTAPPTTPPTTMPPTTVLTNITTQPATASITTNPATSNVTTQPATTVIATNGTTNTPQITTTGTPCNYSQFATDHTMLLPPKTGCSPHLSTVTNAEKAVILAAHNNLRARVAKGQETLGAPGPQPAGANIRELVWNDDLARVSQAWANQCPSGHDCNACRKICSRSYAVGQNIYYYWGYNSSSFWQNAVQAWYDEVKDMPNTMVNSFTSGSPNGAVIGHYTQVVWGKTNEIGCGGIHYSTTLGTTAYPESKIYVCNYGEAGNFLNQPVYVQGTAATQCTSGVSATYSGLCA